MATLQAQSLEAQATFFGIQEAHAIGPELRPMAVYTAISSGSTKAASHGCELWYGTSKPVSVGGR
eukprot:11208255-Lingulodinium_polyedra.AAC.1